MRFLRFRVCCFCNNLTYKGLLKISGEQMSKIAQTVCFLENCGTFILYLELPIRTRFDLFWQRRMKYPG